MDIELKQNRLIMLILSMVLSIILIICWIILSINVLIPWWSSLLDGIREWADEQGAALLGLIIPLIFMGILLIALLFIITIVPICAQAAEIVFIIIALIVRKKWFFIVLMIDGFVSFNILTGISCILILKDNKNKKNIEVLE